MAAVPMQDLTQAPAQCTSVNVGVAMDRYFTMRATDCLRGIGQPGWIPDASDLGADGSLVAWDELPQHPLFRVARSGGRECQQMLHHDSQEQRRRLYGRYQNWAEGVCGLSALELSSSFEVARGLAAFAQCMQGLPVVEATPWWPVEARGCTLPHLGHSSSGALSHGCMS